MEIYHGNYPEYAKEQLDAIENGTANLMKFVVKLVRDITR